LIQILRVNGLNAAIQELACAKRREINPSRPRADDAQRYPLTRIAPSGY
jgi:hypothetical protein